MLGPSLAHNPPMLWAIATYLTIVISVSLPVALLVVVMYRFGTALGATPGRAVAVAMIMAFATILLSLRQRDDHGTARVAVCLLTSFYLVFLGAKGKRDVLRAGCAIPRGMGGARRFSRAYWSPLLSHSTRCANSRNGAK